MILNDIKNKLEEIDEHVYYGAVDTEMRSYAWNYIVFDRVRMASSVNKTGYSDYFDVHIVRENFIEDGLAEQIIEKMLEINGMRGASADSVYEYVVKPNTNTVVEMLTLHFVRARKNV